jgi:hypothetical protein
VNVAPIVPLVMRGDVVTTDLIDFNSGGDVAFRAVDVLRHIDKLPLRHPGALADVHLLSSNDVVEYLTALGRQLSLDTNQHLRAAYRLSCSTSGLPPTVLESLYRSLPKYFEADALHALLERQIGKAFQEGWVEQPPVGATSHRVRIRAFGARSVHVIAGNVPTIAALSIIRNALTRSDAIIKAPSNDPLTAAAIACTMADLSREHPLTRHISVAYWKGGDERVEAALYDRRNVEKIVAWGGSRSVKNVQRYLRPGIDLVTFDPKAGCSIIGADAFASESTLQEAAELLARDVGALNQEACFSTRVAYVECGTELVTDRANELGRRAFAALHRLPEHCSARASKRDGDLALELDAARLMPRDYRVFGGRDTEGAMIVSQHPAMVDFAGRLHGRIANIVPVADVRDCLVHIDKSTQTVGVYPPKLKQRLRDDLALRGVQRIVSLGAAAEETDVPVPQDSVEPLRRLCRWIVDETAAPTA